MSGAWDGSWKQRIYDRLHDRGFMTLTQYAERQPLDPLTTLADSLGVNDVAAVQVESILLDEADRFGTMNRAVRDLLVRRLRNRIPDGWNVSDNYDFTSERAGAYSVWCSGLREEDKPAAKQARAALSAMDLPRGWLPTSPDDPFLLRAFAGLSFGKSPSGAS